MHRLRGESLTPKRATQAPHSSNQRHNQGNITDSETDLERIVGASKSHYDAILSAGPVMAELDWSRCPAVESVPGKLGGAWVFRDTRLPVATVLENLEDLSIDEVMQQFDVTREQIAALLEFVVQNLRETAPVDADPI